MFKLIGKIIFSLFANSIALIAASYFVEGFKISLDPQKFLMVAGILTLINLILKPILKLFFGPLIVLTLGIGIVVINTSLIYILDIVSQDVSINGLKPLLFTTLIIGVVNLVVAFSAKKAFNKE